MALTGLKQSPLRVVLSESTQQERTIMTESQETPTPQPFNSDASFLDAAFSWLASRVARLVAERRLRETLKDEKTGEDRTIGRVQRVSTDESRRQVVALLAKEKDLKANLDARHQATLDDPNTPRLGIDVVSEEAGGLGEEDRLFLIALLVPACSPRMSDEIYEGFNVYGSLNTAHLIELLDPQGVGDWLEARRHFRWDAPMIRQGFLTLDFPSRYANPEDFIGSTQVRLTAKAFSALTGVVFDVEGQPDLDYQKQGN